MAYCNNCGTKLREGARFCDTCGAPVRAAAEAGEQTTQVSGAASAHPLEGMKAQGDAQPLLVCRRTFITYFLHPLPWLLWALVLASIPVSIFVGGIVWLAVPISLALAALSVLVWWIDRLGDYLTIYPDRIVRHEGVFNRTEVVNPIWRIQDVKIEQKWYGFGWIYLETAGDESDEGFGPMRAAAHVRDVIYHLMRPQQ